MSSSLSPGDLLNLARTLLPEGSTTLVAPVSALALLIHAIHTATGFQLLRESSPPANEEASSSAALHNELPADWQPSGVGIGFQYKHDQSSLQFHVKVLEVGGRAIIIGVAVQVRTLPEDSAPSTSFSTWQPHCREPRITSRD